MLFTTQCEQNESDITGHSPTLISLIDIQTQSGPQLPKSIPLIKRDAPRPLWLRRRAHLDPLPALISCNLSRMLHQMRRYAMRSHVRQYKQLADLAKLAACVDGAAFVDGHHPHGLAAHLGQGGSHAGVSQHGSSGRDHRL